MKVYLLDANVLIDAQNLYYGFGVVPEFWEWLENQMEIGTIKMPIEILNEVLKKDDELTRWLKTNQSKFILDEEIENQDEIITAGYLIPREEINEKDVEKIGRDSILIEYALHDNQNRIVVTAENSAPSKNGSNRKVPDVCKTLQVEFCGKYEYVKRLGFCTRKSSN